MSKRAAPEELEYDPMMAKRFGHLHILTHTRVEDVQDFGLSILENRKLAQYVRHVTLDYNPWPDSGNPALTYAVTTGVERSKEATFKAAIAEQYWGEEDATVLLNRLMATPPRDYRQPNSSKLLPDAVVALLLPMLPNLEKWSCGEYQPTFTEKAIQRAKDGIFGSISITHVELSTDSNMNDTCWTDYGFGNFKIFQNLPLLKTISGKGIGGVFISDSGRYEEIPRQASAVSEIIMRHCDLGGSCLGNMIGFSTGLTKLTYSCGGRVGDHSSGSMCSPEVAKMLTPHRLTLQSLDIDFESILYGNLEYEMQIWMQELEDEDNESEKDDEDEDENEKDEDDAENAVPKPAKPKRSTDSNPHFPHLTHLRIGAKLLSRFITLSSHTSLATWLPPTIQELELVAYRAQVEDELTGWVTEMLEKWTELFPELRKVRGVDVYVEGGKELEEEDDYVASGEDEEG